MMEMAVAARERSKWLRTMSSRNKNKIFIGHSQYVGQTLEADEASESGNKVSDAPREKQDSSKGMKSTEPSKDANDGA